MISFTNYPPHTDPEGLRQMLRERLQLRRSCWYCWKRLRQWRSSWWVRRCWFVMESWMWTLICIINQPMRGASIKLWIGLKGTKFNLLWLRYNFFIYQIDVILRTSNSPLLSKTPSGWHGWASWLWQLQGWHKLLFSLVLKFFWYSAWY